MVGKTLSHYHILEKLGEGGMGVVYKARDTRLGRSVAIKVVNAEFTQRFEREAKAISALNHPHICTLHDVGEHEGAPYLVMEYVEGKPLKGPLPAKEALQYAIQVGEALAAAHKAGIVHRDLKPENILLTTEGSVKVLDFGLAKLQPRLAADMPTVTMTEQGVVTGTAPYMSPEQAQGEPVDARSDIFSFGAVLYELLSGRRAFRRETMGATLAAVIGSEPSPLREASPEVTRIVGKMLAKKRESRYQSTEELLADLRAAAQPGAGLVSRRLWLALAAALLIVVAVVAALDVRGLRTGLITWMRAPAPSIRLAVLPFANLSGDPEQEYLSDGLTQEMITQLGGLHPQRLSVIARTSIMHYKKSDKTIDQVGRELGVDYILEGSARREAGRVRITAELIQVRNQAQLWAESYEREPAGILALQSDVARKVAESLALKLLPAEQARLASARPVNPEAYEAYLKGMQSWYRSTPQDLGAALEYFELALKKDPNYAPAHSGVAMVWIGRQEQGYTAPREAGPKAKAAALKAVELDNTLGQAHLSLATVHWLCEWDWARAEEEFKEAIELNPNYPDARAFYSNYLACMERSEEAMVQIQRALELDPFNPFFQGFHAAVLEFAGRYDEAIVQYRKALRAFPDLPFARWNLSSIFFRKAMYEESLAETKAFYAGDREMEEALTQGYAQSGYRGAMRRAADLRAARARKGYELPSDVAEMYAWAGEEAQALEWLEKALEVRDPNMPHVRLYPSFQTLRNTPRFQDILRRMKLPR
jgi:TolB-like protein/tRNA A-37 threonylcarbamoyl transferase component Bud32/Tfp pilus assembly protein PilF